MSAEVLNTDPTVISGYVHTAKMLSEALMGLITLTVCSGRQSFSDEMHVIYNLINLKRDEQKLLEIQHRCTNNYYNIDFLFSIVLL